MRPSPRLSTTAQQIRPGVFAELERHVAAHLARGGNLVGLHIGDTWLSPPRPATDAVGAHAGAVGRYGATVGLSELRTAIARRALATGRAPRELDPEKEILLGAGATHALFCAARAVLDPGDEVLLASPYWPLAPGILSACGARPIEVPFSSELAKDPTIDVAALFRAGLTPRTKALYVINPNNPDGSVLSEREAQAIAAFARENDLWVIADEVYADYTFDAPHVPLANLPEMFERTITATSLSKSHALAGARVGAVIAPEAVVATARRVSTHTVFNVPAPMQRAAIAALDARDWVEEATTHYRAARDTVVAFAREREWSLVTPRGGTYVFFDFERVLRQRPLAELLATAIGEGVMLAPGEAFGSHHRSSARLCFTAVPPEGLQEGLARLERALGRFG